MNYRAFAALLIFLQLSFSSEILIPNYAPLEPFRDTLGWGAIEKEFRVQSLYSFDNPQDAAASFNNDELYIYSVGNSSLDVIRHLEKIGTFITLSQYVFTTSPEDTTAQFTSDFHWLSLSKVGSTSTEFRFSNGISTAIDSTKTLQNSYETACIRRDSAWDSRGLTVRQKNCDIYFVTREKDIAEAVMTSSFYSMYTEGYLSLLVSKMDFTEVTPSSEVRSFALKPVEKFRKFGFVFNFNPAHVSDSIDLYRPEHRSNPYFGGIRFGNEKAQFSLSGSYMRTAISPSEFNTAMIYSGDSVVVANVKDTSINTYMDLSYQTVKLAVGLSISLVKEGRFSLNSFTEYKHSIQKQYALPLEKVSITDYSELSYWSSEGTLFTGFEPHFVVNDRLSFFIRSGVTLTFHPDNSYADIADGSNTGSEKAEVTIEEMDNGHAEFGFAPFYGGFGVEYRF